MANQRDKTRTHQGVYGNITIANYKEVQKILRRERITISAYIADVVTRDIVNRKRRAQTKAKKREHTNGQ